MATKANVTLIVGSVLTDKATGRDLPPLAVPTQAVMIVAGKQTAYKVGKALYELKSGAAHPTPRATEL